jgi:hypothetical protein
MSSVIEPVERRLRAGWRKGLILLAVLVVYQILLHWAISADSGSGLGVFLTIAPLAVALVWFMGARGSGGSASQHSPCSPSAAGLRGGPPA